MVAPTDVLNEVWNWKTSGHLSMEDIVDRLRVKTVPSGYTYCSWILGVYFYCMCGVHGA